jgi:hypothetical protein
VVFDDQRERVLRELVDLLERAAEPPGLDAPRVGLGDVDHARRQCQQVSAVVERLGNLDGDALAVLDAVSREQPAAAARQVDQRRLARDQPGAERHLDAHRDARLAPPLFALVAAVQEHQAQRLRVHRAPHEIVEAAAAQLAAQRDRILVHDHHADRRIDRAANRAVHGVDPARRRDQQVARRLGARHDRAAPDPCERDLHLLEHQLDVFELAVVEHQNGRGGHRILAQIPLRVGRISLRL